MWMLLPGFAVQSVDDRIFIEGMKATGGGCKRRHLSLQKYMDHFQTYEAEPGWNACHGGFSLHVFRVWNKRAARSYGKRQNKNTGNDGLICSAHHAM